MTQFERIILVAFDQLNLDRGAMRTANPATDLVVLIESQRMLTGRNWHPERLFFMVSSARHFAQDARKRGFTVDYRQAATTQDGVHHRLHNATLICCHDAGDAQHNVGLFNGTLNHLERFALGDQCWCAIAARNRSGFNAEIPTRSFQSALNLCHELIVIQ